jgi:hypothetical protein
MILKVQHIVFFILLVSCVDRIQFDIDKPLDYGISVSGFISDQPGPYRISIFSVFDIDSKTSPKTGVEVNKLVISDNEGASEVLRMVTLGIYETSSGGIRGKVGNVYTLRIELLNGSVYESLPDTLLAPGRLDSIYYSFEEIEMSNGASEYGFDVFANGTKGESNVKSFLWEMKGTFKADTNPGGKGCFPSADGTCNFLPVCTGLNNLSPPSAPVKEYERIGPCTCCTCWYDIYNARPILSDDFFSASTDYLGLKIEHIPLSGWYFMYKMRLEINQMSLTYNSFHFFESIRDQKDGLNNLFQPINGKIPINFIQLSGEKLPIQGLFFAAGLSKKSIYISRDNVPNANLIPSVQGFGNVVCTSLFPNATSDKPVFWND